MITGFDFGKYPAIQRHIRHLAAFGMLEEQSIGELVDALGGVLNENEQLRAFKDEVTMSGVYLTEPDFRCEK